MLLGTLKETISLIQEGIAGTVKTGLVDTQQNKGPRHLEAGAAVLQHYQDCWQSIHTGAEHTSRQADRCDRTISQLHAEYEKQWRHVSMLSWMVSELPELSKQVDKILEDLSSLGDLYSDVELALLTLEETLDAREYQEKQLQQRFELSLYQERRRQELEELEAHLSNQYEKRLREAERAEHTRQTERQQVFQQKFQEDLKQFQATGFLDVPLVRAQEMNLESVNLSEDESELEAFLEDKPYTKDKPTTTKDRSCTKAVSTKDTSAQDKTAGTSSSGKANNDAFPSMRASKVDHKADMTPPVSEIVLTTPTSIDDNKRLDAEECDGPQVGSPDNHKLKRNDLSRDASMYFTPSQTMENLQQPNQTTNNQ